MKITGARTQHRPGSVPVGDVQPSTSDGALAAMGVTLEARWGLSPRDLWREGSTWTASAPAVEDAVGTGRTRRAALAALDEDLELLLAHLRGERPKRTRAQQAWVDATIILAQVVNSHGRDWAPLARGLAVASAVAAQWGKLSAREMRTTYLSARRALVRQGHSS